MDRWTSTLTLEAPSEAPIDVEATDAIAGASPAANRMKNGQSTGRFPFLSPA